MKKIFIICFYSFYIFFFLGFVLHSSSNPEVLGKCSSKIFLSFGFRVLSNVQFDFSIPFDLIFHLLQSLANAVLVLAAVKAKEAAISKQKALLEEQRVRAEASVDRIRIAFGCT